MKLASCAILYNPDIEELEINIREYIDNVEILILWLNSTLSDEQKKTSFDRFKNCIYGRWYECRNFLCVKCYI